MAQEQTTWNMTTTTSRPFVRSRRETFMCTRTAWAAGIVLSLSVASAFQTNFAISSSPAKRGMIPQSKHVNSGALLTNRDLNKRWRLSPLNAVTDPEVLLKQYYDDSGWTNADRERLELLFSLAAAEKSLGRVNREPATASSASSPPNRSKRTVLIKRKGSNKLVIVPKQDVSETVYSIKEKKNIDSEQENSRTKAQFRGLSSAKTARRKPSENRVKRSSTMPGFAAESQRQQVYREAVRTYEKHVGHKLVESEQALRKRKKQNGVNMYRNSASVPDSLVQFSQEIHQENRITRSEEKELGAKTQEAIRLQQLYESLENRLAREPTDEEWCAAAGKINMEAIRQAIEEGLEAKNKLVTSNLRLVQSVVNTYIRNGLGGQYNAGDMMQDGILALIRAAEKFEPERGWKFSTYAMYWVRASVKRNQVAQSRIVSVPHRLYEQNKRIAKAERELIPILDRRPTYKELAEATQLSEQQIERSIAANQQRVVSLDQEVTNRNKPLADTGGDRLVDILDTKSKDSTDRKLEEAFLREDLIEALKRRLDREDANLLMLRYGLIPLPQSKRRLGAQPTIAELSSAVGLKPDKVRRTINRALKQLRTESPEEWQLFLSEL